MAKIYTEITLDVSFEDISHMISDRDLIWEISKRDLNSEGLEMVKAWIFKCFRSLEEEMKMRHFLNIMNKYTLEQIETLLSSK